MELENVTVRLEADAAAFTAARNSPTSSDASSRCRRPSRISASSGARRMLLLLVQVPWPRAAEHAR
jgi:hypothetical protein